MGRAGTLIGRHITGPVLAFVAQWGAWTTPAPDA